MNQIMTMVSDILLGAGALGAAVYCGVLARRLKRFNNLENGVGGAVALLSAQVDDMTRTLDLARKAAGHSSDTLTALTERAEAASRRLELMLAALNDLPETGGPEPAGAPPTHDPARETERDQDAEWQAVAEAPPEDDAGTPLFASRRAQPREAAT